MIGLVPVPVLDHELGHLAVDKELERLVAHLLAHDGVDAHDGEGIAAAGCLARRRLPLAAVPSETVGFVGRELLGSRGALFGGRFRLR